LTGPGTIGRSSHHGWVVLDSFYAFV
jgi:hypothetical protein